MVVGALFADLRHPFHTVLTVSFHRLMEGNRSFDMEGQFVHLWTFLQIHETDLLLLLGKYLFARLIKHTGVV